MHTHDDRYYTETEVNNLLNNKSNTDHNHNSVYAALTHYHDDRYYTETEIDTIRRGISNSNYLDNPWFTINQRGKSTYTGNGYTIDRWKCNDGAGGNSTTIINSDGSITITNSNTGDAIWFCQYDKQNYC